MPLGVVAQPRRSLDWQSSLSARSVLSLGLLPPLARLRLRRMGAAIRTGKKLRLVHQYALADANKRRLKAVGFGMEN